MQSPDRRSFMLGAGLAAASMYLPGVRAQTNSSSRSPDRRLDLESLMDAERARIKEIMARENIPGVAVCLIHDGEPVWIEGFGVTDRISNRPVKPDTIFSIQSTSKHFTATAVMLAVQPWRRPRNASTCCQRGATELAEQVLPRPREAWPTRRTSTLRGLSHICTFGASMRRAHRKRWVGI